MTQDAFIEVIIRLDRDRYTHNTMGLQIANEKRGWVWIARLEKHGEWWNDTFRTTIEFFHDAMEDWTGKTVVIDMPANRRMNSATTYANMLQQLGIRGVCLSRDLHYWSEVRSIAVFSDEDATLLSAHIST